MHAVRVADTGSGISRAKWEAIFEPFVQLKDRQPASGRRTGVGLGLAISRELARGMGGDLVLESSSDAGSTFLLTLQGVEP
jgi:signal transduction histidine kinase